MRRGFIMSQNGLLKKSCFQPKDKGVGIKTLLEKKKRKKLEVRI
jgi:hypothetical protein